VPDQDRAEDTVPHLLYRLADAQLDLRAGADGNVSVEQRTTTATRVWSGALDPVVWPHLIDLLRRSEFPAAATPDLAPDTLRVTGAVPAGELRLDRSAVTGGDLGELLRVLDALIHQASDGEVPLEDPLPRLVRRGVLDKAVSHVPPQPLAAFGTIRARPAVVLSRNARALETFSVPDLELLGESRRSDEPQRAVAMTVAGGRELLAVAGDGRIIWVMDATEGDMIHARAGHTGSIRAVTAGGIADRPIVALSAGTDGRVELWETASGRERGEIPDFAGATADVRMGHMGGRDLFVTGGDDGAVRVWRGDDGWNLRTLRGHEGWISAVAMLPGEGELGLVASAGADRLVRIWDVKAGAERHQMGGHSGSVTALAVVGDGTVLCSAGLDGTIRTWDPYAGRGLSVWGAGNPWPTALAGVPDPAGTVLASADADGVVRLWDAGNGAPIRALREPGPRFAARGLAATTLDDGPAVAAGYQDGTVRLWDAGTGALRYRLEPDGGPATAVAFTRTPEGELLICGTGDGTVRIHDAASGALLRVPTPHTGSVRALAFGRIPPYDILVSGSADRTVRVWDARQGAPRTRMLGHRGEVHAVAVTQIGDRVVAASGGTDRTVRTWDARNGAPLLELTGHGAEVGRVAFGTAGDVTLLASGDAAGEVRMWDALTGAAVTVVGGTGAVRALAFGDVDPGGTDLGGTVLAVGWDDGTVALLALPDGSPVRRATLSTTPLAVAFSPDGALWALDADGHLTTV
jgi:WD40 repeat protein